MPKFAQLCESILSEFIQKDDPNPLDWSSMSDGQLDFAASLGLGPKYHPTPPVYYQCPKCGCKKCKVVERHPDTDMNEIVHVCPECKHEGDAGFIKVDPNPYKAPKCPICNQYATGRCRCTGPHSIEDLKKGHGLRCPNGHHFTPEGLAYDPPTKTLD